MAILLLCTEVKNPKAPPYVLLQNKKTVIGRHGDVVMDTSNGKEISKYHAIITFHHHKSHELWMIEDNQSLNGTFVNNRKIHRKVLNEGDEVVLGGGSEFLLGEVIESSEKAECRYKFYICPPNVRFTQNVNPNDDIPAIQTSVTCSICYQEMNAEETLPCGHSFCLSCIHEWASVCAKNMKPCVCPMCRAPFSQSQLTPNEFILTKGELQVWSVESMLRDLGIKNCKVIKGANIFKKWTQKHEKWFWKSYEIVKPNLYRKFTFLFLAEATPSYVFRASVNQLCQALTNFHLELPQEPKKDDLRVILLKYIFENLDPPQPKIKKVVNIIY